MPSFTFKGFTAGSAVALSAAQGASTASNSVAAWGQNTLSASLEILKVEAATIPAPTGVWFEAIGLSGFNVSGGPGPGAIYDPSFDGVTFIWTVERQGGEAAGHDTYGVPNLVTGWDNTRVAYGKKVALFFDEPDTTYTVTCWAIDQEGNSGEASTSVTTANADTIYGGGTTICLDPSGSFAGAPAGAQQITSVSALQSAVSGANSPRRILIARGQDIPNFALNERDGGDVRYIGTFGSGPRPILRSDGFAIMFDFYATTAPQLTLEGLDCRGRWDASTETGKPADPFRPFRSSLLNLSVWDCRFDGFTNVNPTLNDFNSYVVAFGKTEITNWSDYGIYAADSPNAKVAFVGCDVAQNVDAINHSQTERNGMINQQGPVRITGYETLYIGASSFLSRGGWSGGNDQPCLRLNSNVFEGAATNIERTTCEGGGAVVSMSGANQSRVEKQGNHLFDKVLLLSGGGKTGREMLFAHFGGTTVRNMLCKMFDVPNASDVTFDNCLHLNPNHSDPGNQSAPVKIYNSTSLNIRSSTTDLGDSPALAGSTTFSDYTYENNVVHAPTLDSPVQANSVTVSGNFFTPRYRGIKPNFDFEVGTLGGSVGDGSAFTLPYPTGTDQAYWLAIAATDTLHMMEMGGTNYYPAFDGSFSVTYESSQVRITNTSGSTWAGGTSWTLRLDRKSQIPAMDTTYGNPTSMALPRPVAGSGITQNNDAPGVGLWAYDDFLGHVRPAPEGGLDHTGAARATTGRADGALQNPPT